MSAPWTAPTADSPAAVGLKNGGLREITTDIIYPVSRAEKGSFQSGVQQEFRWRSDSSRYWLPRESRLFAEIEFAFGETATTGSGTDTNEFMAIGKNAPKTVSAKYSSSEKHSGGAPPNANVALTAAPLHSLFDQSRFVMNGVTVENQPNLYDTACAQLLTKVDIAGPDTSGSGMCNSLRKDHGRLLRADMQTTTVPDGTTAPLVGSSVSGYSNDVYDTVDVAYERLSGRQGLSHGITETNTDGTGGQLDSFGGRKGFIQEPTTIRSATQCYRMSKQARSQSALPNPKCEILQMTYDPGTGRCKVQIAEPLLLATWQHPYAIPACDMQLFLQISRTWLKDLLWCSDYSYGCLAGDGGIISPIPESGVLDMGQVYAQVNKVEFHAAYIAPAVPSIPPSIGIKYSQVTVQTKLLSSNTINEQVIVPPSCRAVLISLRQRFHHICACREELGRAGGGYNEMVTSLPSSMKDRDGTALDPATNGQTNPLLQGRAVPHNFSTLMLGTDDGWIVPGEGFETRCGDHLYSGALPVEAVCSTTTLGTEDAAAARRRSYNKFSGGATEYTQTFTGDDGKQVSMPKLESLVDQATTHLTDLQVQLGSAAAPKVPFTTMAPDKGLVTRMWNDYLGATGKPLGLRGSAQTLSQYCGFDNANGPSGARNGNWGPIAFLRILNPPNSLSNVLQIRGQLATPVNNFATRTLAAGSGKLLGAVSQGSAEVKAAAQLEMVVCCVADNLLTAQWAPPAEVPIKTAVAPIV